MAIIGAVSPPRHEVHADDYGRRELLLCGNGVDLAVTVIIGAEHGACVTSLVEDIITPLIGTIGASPISRRARLDRCRLTAS